MLSSSSLTERASAISVPEQISPPRCLFPENKPAQPSPRFATHLVKPAELINSGSSRLTDMLTMLALLW